MNNFFENEELANPNVINAEALSSSCSDFFYLLKHAASYAVQGEDTAAAVLLKKALSLANYSSDYIDIAKLLCRFYRLKDFFSVKSCLRKAKDAAKIYCDFTEIENFEAQYQI